MRTWSELQEVLQEIMGPNQKVYYQPPENLKLTYPCIVFERNDAYIHHADNVSYNIMKRYSVTLITKTADNDEYLDKILDLPMCSMEREFKSDGLVHDLFNIYF